MSREDEEREKTAAAMAAALARREQLGGPTAKSAPTPFRCRIVFGASS